MRPFFNEVGLAFADISIDKVEERKDRHQFKIGDVLRRYIISYCIFVLALSKQQIARLPIARYEFEGDWNEDFEHALKGEMRPKEVNLWEILDFYKEKYYNKEVYIRGKSLIERISIFIELSGAGSEKKKNRSLSKELLDDSEYELEHLFAPAEAKAVGEMFERARKGVGLNKKEAERATGIHTANIRKLENGSTSPSLDKMRQYADGLGFDVHIELKPKDRS